MKSLFIPLSEKLYRKYFVPFLQAALASQWHKQGEGILPPAWQSGDFSSLLGGGGDSAFKPSSLQFKSSVLSFSYDNEKRKNEERRGSWLWCSEKGSKRAGCKQMQAQS